MASAFCSALPQLKRCSYSRLPVAGMKIFRRIVLTIVEHRLNQNTVAKWKDHLISFSILMVGCYIAGLATIKKENGGASSSRQMGLIFMTNVCRTHLTPTVGQGFVQCTAVYIQLNNLCPDGSGLKERCLARKMHSTTVAEDFSKAEPSFFHPFFWSSVFYILYRCQYLTLEVSCTFNRITRFRITYLTTESII